LTNLSQVLSAVQSAGSSASSWRVHVAGLDEELRVRLKDMFRLK
jgi:hypothetical protein